MKTTVKKDVKETEKERGELKEILALWTKTSKDGLEYLSGSLSDEKKYLVGYFNTNKKNPKEPDIRIYILDDEGKQDHEICSLWSYESKKGVEYFTGITDENEKVVAFYGDRNNTTRPLIRVYMEK